MEKVFIRIDYIDYLGSFEIFYNKEVEITVKKDKEIEWADFVEELEIESDTPDFVDVEVEDVEFEIVRRGENKMKVLLGEWNSEVAVDLISLVNKAKGFEKKGKAGFKGRTYNWVLLDDILDYVKKSSNWAVLQPMGTNEMGVQAVKTILIHKTGTILESEWVELGYKENDTPQDKGAKDTYVRRYSLGSLLGIAVGSDNDGELDQKTDEEIAEELLKRQNRKTQRDITTFFEEILTEIGSRELLYERLGVERDAFLTSYNENPKDLLAQMKRVFVKDKE